MTAVVPHNSPHITDDDVAAVERVLRSGWIASGQEMAALEGAVVRLYGTGAAYAVSSGTTALHLALVGADIRAGDRVAVPTYSCSALLEAVRLSGARPMIVDVDPDTLTMSPQSLQDVQRRHGDTAAVVIVHMYGAPAALDALRRANPVLIEDCCHSIGSVGTDDRLDGSTGVVAAHSFYATKPVAGGLGGLAYTADAGAAARIEAYRRQPSWSSTRWPPVELRLGDLPAALAASQLSRLPATIRRRAEIAERYLACCPPSAAPAWLEPGRVAAGRRLVYRFVLRCPDEPTRDRWRQSFVVAGVMADRLPPPERLLHRELRLDPAAFPNAEVVASRTLSLPLNPSLTDSDVDRVCAVLAGLDQ